MMRGFVAISETNRKSEKHDAKYVGVQTVT